MNRMIETLGMVGGYSQVWVAVGILVLMALYSLIGWRLCPYLRGTRVISTEEVEAARAHRFTGNRRFMLAMLGGIAAVLAGLGMISKAIYPQYGFLLVVSGVYLLQTEPSRLRLREAIIRVVATEDAGPPARIDAKNRLRNDHGWLVGLNFLIPAAVIAGLLAF